MTGKEKCRLLRQIREAIARQNDIDFDYVDCPDDGEDCTGTCALCEAEINYLEQEINKKAKNGETIWLHGLSVGAWSYDYDDIALFKGEGHEVTTGFPALTDIEENDDDSGEMTRLSKIDRLELSVRACNCLKRSNIYTIGDLLDQPVDALTHIRNLGRKSVDEILNKLNDTVFIADYIRFNNCSGFDELYAKAMVNFDQRNQS